MAKRRPIFDNKRVTALAIEYSQNPTIEIRNKILKKALPLLEAALSRKKVPPELRDDIRQECAIKLLSAIPKFDPQRGKAFGFFWATICNNIITQGQKMTSTSISLTGDTEDSEDHEFEADVFHAPENRRILKEAATALNKAFDSERFQIPDKRKHRKVFSKIKRAIQSGDLFSNRADVIKSLRKYKVKRTEIQRYIDYALVVVRQYLLAHRDEVEKIPRTGFNKVGGVRRSI